MKSEKNNHCLLNSWLRVVKSEFAFLANVYTSIPAKFQDSSSIRQGVIARTNRQAEKIQRLNYPIFGFGQITGFM